MSTLGVVGLIFFCNECRSAGGFLVRVYLIMTRSHTRPVAILLGHQVCKALVILFFVLVLSFVFKRISNYRWILPSGGVRLLSVTG